MARFEQNANADEPGLLTAEALVEAYKSGALFKLIFGDYDFSNDDQLKVCIAAHNSGQINLLSLTSSDDFQNIDTHSLFVGQNFYCEAIPELSASPSEMMRCVDALVIKAGADLAANQPNVAFKKWCEADLGRALKVIELAKNADALACKFVSFALNAGNSIEEAIFFVENYTDERRLAAIAALGRMNFKNEIEAQRGLSALSRSLTDNPDELLNGSVLLGALEIASKVEQIQCSDVIQIIDRVCVNSGPQVNFACTRALWLHAKFLDDAAVAALLNALLSIDPTHKGTVRELDNALRALMETPHADRAVRFLARLLVSTDGALTLSDFKSFGGKLIKSDQFERIFVSWMLSGERALCEGLATLLRGETRSKKPINLSIQEFDLSTDEQIFLCKKAIGYLFLQPVIAAAVLVSVLRICTGTAASAVQGLLFEPLLRNYGGEIRDYLESIDQNDGAFSKVQEVLKHSDQYINNLKSVGNIKELHPSERQRQIERIRSVDEIRKIQKDAMKDSIFINLVRRSVILYGKRSITYVEGPGDQRKPVEMELKPHSITFEMPRMQIVDPIGLNFILFVFRVEKLRS
jgi:hypothetical protein